jgi:O-antigen ligase
MLHRSIPIWGKVAKGCVKIVFVKKTIFILFAILLFFVPLVLWPFTSEVFEFNKMVLVYILTTLIVGAWAIRCINERKFIFRRTILDIPLLVFAGSQFLSTLLSIDPSTSWLGYYSRFNGGLLSNLCYSLLYWVFVSNLENKDALKLINYSLLPSAFLVSVYGVLEHFGIDKNLWVQDVQSRVFSTLGQPNWLAAWLVAFIPVTWALLLREKVKSTRFWIYLVLSVLFFWTLIFTKSRSGILGFGVASLLFWGSFTWHNLKNVKKIFSPLLLIAIPVVVICLVSGTQFTPSLYSLIKGGTKALPAEASAQAGPALETGGTESGKIREIVWRGAVQVWAHYPIFGTGVETFAYSYYKYRPADHNLVSEWDFIYNKAHNEFLNIAANSGTLGILSYLFLIGASTYLMLKVKTEDQTINFALLAGYVSLAVTNFFGFSVVPTQLQLFLFPAIAIALAREGEKAEEYKTKKLTSIQKFGILVTCSLVLLLLYSVSKYWFADTLYAKGKNYNAAQKPDGAIPYLTQAASLEPTQTLYHGELASSYTYLALGSYEQKDTNKSKEYADLAIAESGKSISLSPANINQKRLAFGIFVRLSTINPNYLLEARDVLIDAITHAPTDAKLYYNLGLVYARTGQTDQAIETLKKTVELKADYRDARLAYALLLIDKKQNEEARNQLEYILTNIAPDDSLAKQTLEGIK